MFTTFIIVFITTMVIVFIIRVAVKKFSDLQESRSRTRQTTTTISASRQDTERGTTRIYSIHRRSSLPIIDSQRPPPPQYDQSILNDFSILNQNERKEIIIISDKDLPSYDEVVAQKVRENEQNTSTATTLTTTTTAETITASGTDSFTTTTVNSHTNNSCNNNDNSIRINTTIVTVTPMINTPLHVPNQQS